MKRVVVVAGFVMAMLPVMAAAAPAKQKQDEEAERLFFVLANVEHTLAHEMGHVVLDEFDIPVLGNMEIAADQMGLFLFSSLIGANDNFVQGKLDILAAIQDEMRMEWESQDAAKNNSRGAWSSQHPIEPQRFYNIACLVYGSDPPNLEEVRETMRIPYSRAFYCRDEFEVAAQAVSWILNRAGRQTAYTGHTKDRKITIEYEEPESREGKTLGNWLRQTGVIESMVSRAEVQFDFKRPLRILLANCQYPEAMWMSGKGEVVICYPLIERYYYLSRFRWERGGEHILNMEEWSAFCLSESVAEHYTHYCRDPLSKPAPGKGKPARSGKPPPKD